MRGGVAQGGPRVRSFFESCPSTLGATRQWPDARASRGPKAAAEATLLPRSFGPFAMGAPGPAPWSSAGDGSSALADADSEPARPWLAASWARASARGPAPDRPGARRRVRGRARGGARFFVLFLELPNRPKLFSNFFQTSKSAQTFFKLFSNFFQTSESAQTFFELPNRALKALGAGPAPMPAGVEAPGRGPSPARARAPSDGGQVCADARARALARACSAHCPRRRFFAAGTGSSGAPSRRFSRGGLPARAPGPGLGSPSRRRSRAPGIVWRAAGRPVPPPCWRQPGAAPRGN